MALRYLPALDGLRALAVLAVISGHAFDGFVPGAFMGVELFFVLSGFLITGLLVEEHRASGTIFLRAFYLRRACRLLPALGATILLSGLLTRFAPADPDALGWGPSAVAVLLSCSNFLFPRLGLLTHTWSLGIEEQYYLIWPPVLLAFLANGKNARWLPAFILLAVFGGVLMRAGLQRQHLGSLFLYTFTPIRLDGLLLGSLLSVAGEHLALRGIVAGCSRWRLPELILVAFAYLLLRAAYDDPGFYEGGFTLMAASFTLLIECLVQSEPNHYLVRCFNSAVPRWIGKRSYGLYLYHYPIFLAFGPLNVPKTGADLLRVTLPRIGLSIAAAALSYRFLEMPFLNLKARLRWEARSKSSVSKVVP